jgi:hypothetical protein
MMKLLLSFALAALLALCVSYLTLAYYRLVSIAKGIVGPFEWPADVASSGIIVPTLNGDATPEHIWIHVYKGRFKSFVGVTVGKMKVARRRLLTPLG